MTDWQPGQTAAQGRQPLRAIQTEAGEYCRDSHRRARTVRRIPTHGNLLTLPLADVMNCAAHSEHQKRPLIDAAVRPIKINPVSNPRRFPPIQSKISPPCSPQTLPHLPFSQLSYHSRKQSQLRSERSGWEISASDQCGQEKHGSAFRSAIIVPPSHLQSFCQAKSGRRENNRLGARVRGCCVGGERGGDLSGGCPLRMHLVHPDQTLNTQ